MPIKSEVIILYNCPDTQGSIRWRESDAGVLNEVDSVASALDVSGVACCRHGVQRLENVVAILKAAPGAMVFNLVERLEGGSEACNRIPELCRTFGHPCTGSSSACLKLTQNKWHTKERLRACGVPVPAACVVPPGAAVDFGRIPNPPLIVKPLCADGSEGIDGASLVRDPAGQLDQAVKRVHAHEGQSALIEVFVEGREFNLSLLETEGRVSVLPLAEIDFSLFPPGRPHIVDYAVKWVPGTIPGKISPRRVPACVENSIAERLRETALAVWRACGCSDYVRVDFRVDQAGRPFVLEVNANPDISPNAGFPACLAAAGITFPDFIGQLLRNAAARG
ncbi:MAG: ATP-grasp domain-containing protein [Kiritimatiellae bacterium]|nr:ATP-grasp domain-containing protein [Kiritimatiellia bacterium]